MIAERIGCSVQRAKKETTATEFIMWKEKFRKEVNEEFHRDDFLFALVCYEIYMFRIMLGSKEKKMKFEDFLIRFQEKDQKEITKTITTVTKAMESDSDRPNAKSLSPEHREKVRKEGMALKAAMMNMFGMDSDGKIITPSKSRFNEKRK